MSEHPSTKGEHTRKKVLVAAADSWEGYKMAVDMCWRGRDVVIKCEWVP